MAAALKRRFPPTSDPAPGLWSSRLASGPDRENGEADGRDPMASMSSMEEVTGLEVTGRRAAWLQRCGGEVVKVG